MRLKKVLELKRLTYAPRGANRIEAAGVSCIHGACSRRAQPRPPPTAGAPAPVVLNAAPGTRTLAGGHNAPRWHSAAGVALPGPLRCTGRRVGQPLCGAAPRAQQGLSAGCCGVLRLVAGLSSLWAPSRRSPGGGRVGALSGSCCQVNAHSSTGSHTAPFHARGHHKLPVRCCAGVAGLRTAEEELWRRDSLTVSLSATPARRTGVGPPILSGLGRVGLESPGGRWAPAKRSKGSYDRIGAAGRPGQGRFAR
jgi:hypothetical protein